MSPKLSRHGIGRPPVPPARDTRRRRRAPGSYTDAPNTVTMDDIATAAGVGKGTLFRAFGSRDSLLGTRYGPPSSPPCAKLWKEQVTASDPERHRASGPSRSSTRCSPSSWRTAGLIRMRERDPAGIRQAKNYKWSHGILQSLIEDAAPAATAGDAGYAAHVLLAALDIDLIDELLATGRSLKDIRHAQAALAQAVIDDSPHR